MDGRRRVEDNSAYDFCNAAEMATEMRSLVEMSQVFGDIADQVRALPVTERAAFLEQRLTMLHTTPHGLCGSNIVENPCATVVSCLGGCRPLDSVQRQVVRKWRVRAVKWAASAYVPLRRPVICCRRRRGGILDVDAKGLELSDCCAVQF